jgi:hypothetical protein
MKIKLALFLVVLIFIIAVIFSACSWVTNSGEEIIFPENNVSFMHHVQPFLQQNCSYSPCHSGFNLAGGIALVDYHSVISAPRGFIVQENPDGSRFVQILEHRTPHFTNFYRGNIKDNQIKGIRTWIKEGPLNN